MGIITILWEKWVEFRRDFYKITLAAMIAPMMYLLVFGLGVQNMSHGKPYLLYLIPGMVSLTTMNGSFNAITQWDSPMQVIADTTAMGAPMEIHYQLCFYSNSIGDRSQLPQEAAKRVLIMASVIIVVGGIFNAMVKRRRAA